MNWLDIVLILGLLVFFAGGLQDGSIKQVFSFGFLVLAIGVAGFSHEFFASYLGILPESWAHIAAFGIPFCAVTGALTLLLSRFADRFHLGEGSSINRFIGGLVGMAGGITVAELFAFLVLAYPVLALEVAVQESELLHLLFRELPITSNFIPAAILKAAHAAASFVQ